jgi:hypothetical protein
LKISFNIGLENYSQPIYFENPEICNHLLLSYKYWKPFTINIPDNQRTETKRKKNKHNCEGLP